MSQKFISIFDKRLSVLPTPPSTDSSAGDLSTTGGQLASSKLQQTRQPDHRDQSPQKRVNGGANLLDIQAQSPNRQKTGKSAVQGKSQAKAPFV